jgi:hypothetical protein
MDLWMLYLGLLRHTVTAHLHLKIKRNENQHTSARLIWATRSTFTQRLGRGMPKKVHLTFCLGKAENQRGVWR